MNKIWAEFNKSVGLCPFTLDGLKKYLTYDPQTGVFTKNISPIPAEVGRSVVTVNGRGYVTIRIGGKLYAAHRLAWIYTYGAWPVGHLDHRNRDRSDNHI